MMARSLVRSVGVRERIGVLLVLAGLALAACGSDDTSQPARPSPRLAEPIKYEVIGGDAFRDDKLTVQADGSAQVQTRAGTRTAKLTAAELSALEHEVENLGNVESKTTDPPQPDALSYRFTYRGRQVETDSGALPAQLRALIGNFDDLIDRYGA